MGGRKYLPYSSDQHILLVGEGDFTSSSALASAFGDAYRLIATSLDSEEYIYRRYAEAPRALQNLSWRGAQIIYGFDATKDTLDFGPMFDRIVFNFPHAGYFGMPESVNHVIKRHQDLIQRFLLNASNLIRRWDGEIHLTIQDYDPYNRWNIAALAQSCGLRLKESILFDMSAYPGYCNRRGTGKRPGNTFPVAHGCIRTFKCGF